MRECECVRLHAKEIQGSRRALAPNSPKPLLMTLAICCSAALPILTRAPAHCSRCLSGISSLSSRAFASSGSLRQISSMPFQMPPPHYYSRLFSWAPEHAFYTKREVQLITFFQDIGNVLEVIVKRVRFKVLSICIVLNVVSKWSGRNQWK